jgi:hypothetical protein
MVIDAACQGGPQASAGLLVFVPGGMIAVDAFSCTARVRNWHGGDPSRTRSVPVRIWGVQLTRPTGLTFPLGNDLTTHTAADQGISTAPLRWHEAGVDSVPRNLSRYSFG